MNNSTFLRLLTDWNRLAAGLASADSNRAQATNSAWATFGLGLVAGFAGVIMTTLPVLAVEPAPAESAKTAQATGGSSPEGTSDDPLFIEPVEPSDPLPPLEESFPPANPSPESTPRNPTPSPVDDSEPVEIDTSLDQGPEASELPRVEFAELDSIQADGRSIRLVEGQVLKADGSLFTDDVVVTLTSGAGKFVGDDADEERPGFQVVAKNGKFAARLRAPIQAQRTRIRAAIDPVWDLKMPLADLQRETQDLVLPTTPYQPLRQPLVSETYTDLEFTTYLRPSLVSGSLNVRLGKGTTDFYGPFSEFLNPSGSDGYEFDVDGGLFATGALGEWLFTGALALDRGLNDDCNGSRLYRDYDNCDQLYPVYGDSSTVDYLTPSQDSIYARLERNSLIPGADPDYIMWGDWGTNEFAQPSQLFSATTRNLHGAKLNYNFGDFQFTGAYATNIDGFRRDTIQLNGTSGLYFFSRRLLVPGSENLFIETEEINRPGFVVERKDLRRGADYEIDYDRGSITFRRSVLGTEFDPFGTTLVRRVVATYQFEDDGDANNGLFGGRLQYNLSRELGKESWIGATYLNEDQGDRDFQLFGADFLVPLGTAGSFIGEYARSSNGVDFLGDVDGSAYRLEVEGKPTDWVRARAYYRTAEDGFANDATFSFVPGQTRYGAQATAQAGPSTQVQVQVDRENNFGRSINLRNRFTGDLFDADRNLFFDPNPDFEAGDRVDNTLTTVRGGIIQKLGASDLSLEYVYRDRDDNRGTSLNSTSNQIVSKLLVPLNEKFAFRAQNELNLGDSDELYPNRTTLGLEWAAYPGVKLRLAHQFFDGGILSSSAITSLDTLADYALSENTDLYSRYSVLGTNSGMRGYGSVGLNHRWKVSPGFRINVGYERIFDDLFNRTGAGNRFETAYAVGQTGSILGLSEGSSYSVGFDYTGSETFKGSGRFEYRDTSDGDLFLTTVSGVGKLSPSFSLLGRVDVAGASNQTLVDRLGDTLNARIGLAYRNPLDDRFNGLLRLEHRQNGDITPNAIGTGSESRDTVLATELIYAPDWRWEFYGKYAMRWADTKIGGGFSNDSRISLAQLRALYRFDYRWDVAAEARWISQPTADFDELGWAAELGYYLSPDLRVYLGYSFGSVDDRDFSGYRSEGGIYGGLNFKVNRLFNDFGVQVPVPKEREVQAEAALPAGAIAEPSPYEAPVEAVEESEAMPTLEEAAPTQTEEEIPRALF